MCWKCDAREAYLNSRLGQVDPRPLPAIGPEEFYNLIETYAKRHGLDDEQAIAAIYRHTILGTAEHH